MASFQDIINNALDLDLAYNISLSVSGSLLPEPVRVPPPRTPMAGPLPPLPTVNPPDLIMCDSTPTPAVPPSCFTSAVRDFLSAPRAPPPPPAMPLDPALYCPQNPFFAAIEAGDRSLARALAPTTPPGAHCGAPPVASHAALARGWVDVAEALTDTRGCTLLAHYVYARDHRYLPWFLSIGARPSRPCAPGRETALHLAARTSRIPQMRLLIAAGADLEAREKHGMTPLLAAAWAGAGEAVALLAAAGARVWARASDGGLVEAATGSGDAATILVARRLLGQTPETPELEFSQALCHQLPTRSFSLTTPPGSAPSGLGAEAGFALIVRSAHTSVGSMATPCYMRWRATVLSGSGLAPLGRTFVSQWVLTPFSDVVASAKHVGVLFNEPAAFWLPRSVSEAAVVLVEVSASPIDYATCPDHSDAAAAVTAAAAAGDYAKMASRAPPPDLAAERGVGWCLLPVAGSARAHDDLIEVSPGKPVQLQRRALRAGTPRSIIASSSHVEISGSAIYCTIIPHSSFISDTSPCARPVPPATFLSPAQAPRPGLLPGHGRTNLPPTADTASTGGQLARLAARVRAVGSPGPGTGAGLAVGQGPRALTAAWPVPAVARLHTVVLENVGFSLKPFSAGAAPLPTVLGRALRVSGSNVSIIGSSVELVVYSNETPVNNTITSISLTNTTGVGISTSFTTSDPTPIRSIPIGGAVVAKLFIHISETDAAAASAASESAGAPPCPPRVLVGWAAGGLAEDIREGRLVFRMGQVVVDRPLPGSAVLPLLLGCDVIFTGQGVVEQAVPVQEVRKVDLASTMNTVVLPQPELSPQTVTRPVQPPPVHSHVPPSPLPPPPLTSPVVLQRTKHENEGFNTVQLTPRSPTPNLVSFQPYFLTLTFSSLLAPSALPAPAGTPVTVVLCASGGVDAVVARTVVTSVSIEDAGHRLVLRDTLRLTVLISRPPIGQGAAAGTQLRLTVSGPTFTLYHAQLPQTAAELAARAPCPCTARLYPAAAPAEIPAGGYGAVEVFAETEPAGDTGVVQLGSRASALAAAGAPPALVVADRLAALAVNGRGAQREVAARLGGDVAAVLATPSEDAWAALAAMPATGAVAAIAAHSSAPAPAPASLAVQLAGVSSVLMSPCRALCPIGRPAPVVITFPAGTSGGSLLGPGDYFLELTPAGTGELSSDLDGCEPFGASRRCDTADTGTLTAALGAALRAAAPSEVAVRGESCVAAQAVHADNRVVFAFTVTRAICRLGLVTIPLTCTADPVLAPALAAAAAVTVAAVVYAAENGIATGAVRAAAAVQLNVRPVPDAVLDLVLPCKPPGLSAAEPLVIALPRGRSAAPALVFPHPLTGTALTQMPAVAGVAPSVCAELDIFAALPASTHRRRAQAQVIDLPDEDALFVSMLIPRPAEPALVRSLLSLRPAATLASEVVRQIAINITFADPVCIRAPAPGRPIGWTASVPPLPPAPGQPRGDYTLFTPVTSAVLSPAHVPEREAAGGCRIGAEFAAPSCTRRLVVPLVLMHAGGRTAAIVCFDMKEGERGEAGVEFDVQAPLKHATSRRIAYTNSFHVSRTLRVLSDHPRVRPRCDYAHVEAGETTRIEVDILPLTEFLPTTALLVLMDQHSTDTIALHLKHA